MNPVDSLVTPMRMLMAAPTHRELLLLMLIASFCCQGAQRPLTAKAISRFALACAAR